MNGEEIETLSQFIGYGSANPHVAFLALEEAAPAGGGVQIPGYHPHAAWEDYRREALANFFAAHQPTYLIAYGLGAHARVGEFFDVPAWQQVGQAGHVGRAASDGPIICKTGFFGQGRFNRHNIPALVDAMRAL